MISITTDVHCDGERCGMWLHFRVATVPAIAEAGRAARRDGWKSLGGGRILCPRCTGANPDYWTRHKGGKTCGETLELHAP